MRTHGHDATTELHCVEEDEIFAAFPADMLTAEVWQQVTTCLEAMEQSHTSAAKAMQSVKKLTLTIPNGEFHLLLQGLLTPVIKLKDRWVCHCDPVCEAKTSLTLIDMVPDVDLAKNLPLVVQTMAAAAYSLIKTGYGCKMSIMGISKIFDIHEKETLDCSKRSQVQEWQPV